MAQRPPYPLLLEGAVSHWAALDKWSNIYLQDLVQECPMSVRLVKGNRESDLVCFVNSTLTEFFDETDKQGLYLKEFNLLQYFPSLKQDVDFSLFHRAFYGFYSYLWMGHRGSKTGLHYDTLDNFLCHIRGVKTLYLLDKQFKGRVPLSSRFDAYARLAKLDLSDQKAVATLNDPELAEHIIKVSLKPGDVLYIPKHWWHQVENHSFSISASGFFASPLWYITTGIFEIVRKWLHDVAGYRRNDCTCHMR